MSEGDEASQMWQRWDIVCKREDGLKDTARDSGQAASTGSNGEVVVTSAPDLQA